MGTISILAAAVLAGTVLAPTAHANIVNLDTGAVGTTSLAINVDARRAGFPRFLGSGLCPCFVLPGGLVDVRFDPGVYTSTLIFGTFSDWFAGPNTGGNRTSYVAGIGADPLQSTEGQGANTFTFFTGGDAVSFGSTVNKVETFTILTPTVLSFGVADPFITDNIGGVSLRLELIGEVPGIDEPAALLLLAAGLAGTGAARRRQPRG